MKCKALFGLEKFQFSVSTSIRIFIKEAPVKAAPETFGRLRGVALNCSP